MKKRGFAVQTVIIAFIAILILVVVLMMLRDKMAGVKSEIDEKADSFKDMCHTPGSGRVCTSGGTCSTGGGYSLGNGPWSDCPESASECCQY